MNKKSSLALLSSIALLAPLGAAAQTASDDWSFAIAPYVWLPSVKGDLNYSPPAVGGSSPSVHIDASKLLDDLNFAAMFTARAQKGRWLVTTDFNYIDLSGGASKVRSFDVNPGSGPINVSTSSVSADADVKLTGMVWTLAGGYSLVLEPKNKLNVLGGVRYLGLEAETNWNLSATVTGNGPLGASVTVPRSGSTKQKENIWTGVVGLEGRVNLGDSDWFVNGYVDVGSGSSVFTWQGMAGIGYAFKWGDLVLDYRYLYYSQNDGKLIDNISLGGPAIGANFRF